MRAYIAVGALLAVAAACTRWAWAWLTRLELESRSKAHEGLLQAPEAVQKVAAPSIFEDATRTLSIVVPAFNEAERLPPTLEECLQYLTHRRDRQGPLFTFEVIVVDDGSRDDTVRVALEFVKRYGVDTVRVLQLPENKGKGYAVRAGMLVGRGQRLLFMDADGATKVSDLEKLEAELQRVASGAKAEALGLVVGSRAHLEQTAIARRSWFRNLLMHGFHLLVLLVAGGAVRDTQCGFKLFSRRAARLLYCNQRLQRWCFDVELLALARQLRVPVGEVAVTWAEIPGSKIRFLSIVHMSWELLAILLGYHVTHLWSVQPQPVLQKKAA